MDSCACCKFGSQGAPGYRNLAAYSVKGVTASIAGAREPSIRVHSSPKLLQIVSFTKNRVVPRKERLHCLLDYLLTVKQSVPDKGRSRQQIMLRIVQVFLGTHKSFPGIRDKDRVRLHTAASLLERRWMEMTPSDATVY